MTRTKLRSFRLLIASLFLFLFLECTNSLFAQDGVPPVGDVSAPGQGQPNAPNASGLSAAADRQFNVAGELQNAGDFQGALSAWTDFLDRNGSDPRCDAALYYRSICYFQLNKFTESIADLRRLLELPSARFAKRPDALYFAALANQKLAPREPHRLEAAKILWETLLSEYPQTKNWANATFRLADIYYQQKKYELAISRYRQIVKRAPNSTLTPLSVMEIGRAFLELGRSKDAASIFNQFLGRWPNHENRIDVTLLLADAQFAQNQIETAEKNYAYCCSPGSAKGASFHSLDYALIRWGDCLQLLNQTAPALGAYERLIREFPTSGYLTDAYLNAGRCLTKLDKPEQAIEYLKKAREDLRTDTAARFLLAELYLKTNKPEEALKELDPISADRYECKPTDPENVQTLVRSYCLLRARTWYANDSRLKDSLGQWQAIAQRWPQSASASWSLYMAAQVCFQTQQWNQCLALCQQLKQKYPKSDQILESDVLAAESLFSLEKYDQAGELFYALFQNYGQDERKWGWLVRASWSYDQQGNSQKVRDILLNQVKFIKSSELRPEALYCLGKALFELKEYPVARKSLELCRDNYPNFAAMDRVLFVLGQVYEAVQLRPKALESYQTLQKKYPNSAVAPNALYQMGLLNAQTSENNRSLEYYEKLLSLPKENPLRSAALLDCACILYDNQDNQKAFDRARQYAQEYPDLEGFVEACYIQAVASEQLNNIDQALKSAQMGLERLNQQADEAANGQADKTVADKTSAADSEAATERKSWEIKLRVVMANCFVQQNKLDAAIEELARVFALQKETGLPIANQDGLSYLYANSLLKNGKRDEAKNWFGQTYKQFPDSAYHAALAFSLGLLAMDDKLYPAAETYFKESQKTGSFDLAVKATGKLAWTYYLQDQFDKAAEQFADTINRAAKVPEAGQQALAEIVNEAKFMNAECEYFQNRFQQAFDLYEPLEIANKENRTLAWFHFAQCANQLNKFDKTQEIIARAVDDSSQELKPDCQPDEQGLYPALLYEKAYALFKMDKKDEARTLFEKITDWVDKQSGEPQGQQAVAQTAAAKSWFYRGELLFLAEKYDEAIRQYYQVIYGFPCPEVQADASYEAARCFESLKMIPQAKKQYQLILDKFPNHAKAAVAKQKLLDLK